MKIKYLLISVFCYLYIVNVYANVSYEDTNDFNTFIINKKILDDDVKFNGKIYFEINKTNNRSSAYEILNGNYRKNFNNFRVKTAKFGLTKRLNQYSTFDFKLRSDYNNLSIDTAALNFEWVPKLTVTLGQSYIPLSLDGEDDGNGYQFFEQNRYYTTANVFLCNGLGAKAKYIGDGFGSFIGVFGNSIKDSISIVNKNAFSFRTYVNPYLYGNNLVHIGLNYFSANIDYNRKRRIAKYDKSRDFINLVYDFKRIENAGVEFAMNFDYFNFQSEYSRGFLTPAEVGYKNKFGISNYYYQIGFILTGETMGYSEGSFGKILKVNNPTTERSGFGAYELTFRFSRTDLQDKLKNSMIFDYGKYDEYSVALNWMPVDFVKTILQYSRIKENYIDTYTIMANNNKKSNSYDLFSFKLKVFY